MNRDLLDALGAVAADFYVDSLHRYRSLLFDRDIEPDDEAMVIWRVLLAIDELVVTIQAAKDFDDATNGLSSEQEDLPF